MKKQMSLSIFMLFVCMIGAFDVLAQPKQNEPPDMTRETTGGGANPGGMFRLSEHFGIFVPTGRAINPITKTNWERTGVKPDVEVPKELALKTAHLLALNKSLEKTKEENVKSALKQLIEQTQKEIDEMKKK